MEDRDKTRFKALQIILLSLIDKWNEYTKEQREDEERGGALRRDIQRVADRLEETDPAGWLAFKEKLENGFEK